MIPDGGSWGDSSLLGVLLQMLPRSSRSLGRHATGLGGPDRPIVRRDGRPRRRRRAAELQRPAPVSAAAQDGAGSGRAVFELAESGLMAMVNVATVGLVVPTAPAVDQSGALAGGAAANTVGPVAPTYLPHDDTRYASHERVVRVSFGAGRGYILTSFTSLLGT